MKTPREVLLARHSQAQPKLDQVRLQALTALEPKADVAVRDHASLGQVLTKAWLELVWPSRRIWAGLAAIWLAVLAANLQMQGASTAVPGARPAPTRQWVQAIAEQRRWLAELLPPAPAPPVQTRPPAARPRSERHVHFKAC